jgi:beta-mannosidase
MGLANSDAPGTLDLAGAWSISSSDGRHACAYAVPGDVHSALFAAGLVSDPYSGRNELDQRWVADCDWVAARTFNLGKSPQGRYFLDIDYLDTVAEIALNGTLVLQAENCFRRYRPDVAHALRDGENEITITFKSNTTASNEKQAAQPFYIPYSVNNCPIPNSNMLRKPACHYGWDWNLAIMPFGLYGRINLRHMQKARIEHVQTSQRHAGAGKAVTLDVTVTLVADQTGSTELAFKFDGQTITRTIALTPGQSVHSVAFTIAKPELWWPAGSGAQHLYDLEVTCEGQTESRRIGLRTIELLTDKDETGSRFAFRVNGIEIFCKGANWIPADALPSRATPELTRKLLQAAKDVHMNMIRVWGGGYYEQDVFYQLCDEMGLLVWQDFMFACSLYPSTPDFIAEVKAEVDYQVRRLQHHACLALWCGDNELIGALTTFPEPRANRDRYLVNYDRLNRAIEETMRHADPHGLWWPSSPSPGILDFGDAWHDDKKGDMHFWSVWHEGRDFEHYRDVKPRFCSEFGFQSFPSLARVREFASAEDMNISSPVMEHHQRNKGGNARIAETMFRNFRFPMDFAKFIYLSQIQHGLAMRTAIEYWRSLKPHCMGTLYWQLNDTWPVASWSGLDHGGGWKAMHHMAAVFFAPVLICVIPDKASGELIVSGVNDTGRDLTLDIDFEILAGDGTRKGALPMQAKLPAANAVEITRFDESLVPEDGYLFWTHDNGEGKSIRQHLAMLPYKHLALPAPSVSVRATRMGGHLNIDISAASLALYVGLETSVHGSYSHNVFDLLPGESRTVTFTPDNPADMSRAATDLVVRDLYSSSHSKEA